MQREMQIKEQKEQERMQMQSRQIQEMVYRKFRGHLRSKVD